MLMFGGQVKQGIDTSWHSHAAIPKTAIDLFRLAPFGISRVDSSASLAGRVDPGLARPAPPPLGSTIVQPPVPNPAPTMQAPGPWGGPNAQPLPALKDSRPIRKRMSPPRRIDARLSSRYHFFAPI